MSSPALPSDQVTLPDGLREDVWTIQRVLVWSAKWLQANGVDKDAVAPRLEAELLLAHVLNSDRMQLYLHLEKPLTKQERDQFKTLLRRRITGEPISQLLGYRDFYRHRFAVTRDVLTPRPDTEILVERTLELLRSLASPAILEIGTGSGCVAITLAKELPQASVEGWDISAEALAVARLNAQQLKAENVLFLHQDVFKAEKAVARRFHVIVSNPPYLRRADAETLSISVRNFEPATALFDGHGDDGLTFYRLLAERSGDWLEPGGWLAVECGYDQAGEVKSILAQHKFEELTITKDLSGKDRVVTGRLGAIS